MEQEKGERSILNFEGTEVFLQDDVAELVVIFSHDCFQYVHPIPIAIDDELSLLNGID
jgi:hypothetical protein